MGQPKVSVFSHLSLSDQSLQPVHIFKMCTCLGSPFESPAADLGEYGRKVLRAEENWWIGRILTAATANYPLLCRSTIQLSDHPPHFHPRPLSIFPPRCTHCNSLTSTTRFLIESPQCVTLFACGKTGCRMFSSLSLSVLIIGWWLEGSSL